MAVVAQQAEHRASSSGDAGSIPADRSRSSEALAENGFTAERLLALARKAVEDGLEQWQIPRDAIDVDDAYGHATAAGLDAAERYDESRDAGARRLPRDVRFRQFAYLRMRLRLIDWLRKNYGYTRNGTNGRVLLAPDVWEPQTGPRVRAVQAADGELLAGAWASLPVDEFDPADALASRRRIARWQAAAELLGVEVTELALLLLDDATENVLRETS